MNDKPMLRIVILYAGFDAFARAQGKLQRLITEANTGFDVETSSWEFDELRAFPQLRDRATEEVLAADIVIVSTFAATELPLEIWTWIESWAPRKKGRSHTLVVLVGRRRLSSAPPPLLEAYFRQIAEIGGMEFLSTEHQATLPTGSAGPFHDRVSGA